MAIWHRRVAAALTLVATILAACSGTGETFVEPPRGADPIRFTAAPSTVAVDLVVSLDDLQAALEREVPLSLWDIHRDDMACVPSKRLKVAFVKLKSPTITCDIDGEVTRGKVRLSGRGRDLIVTLPVTAEVRAHDVAGLLKGETGTAAAEVQITLQLDLAPNWQLGGKAKLDYRWSREPGIDFMGRRITFTDKADKEMVKLRATIERALIAELAKVPLRPAAERGWRLAHTVVELNRAKPEVWARLTPEQVRYGGYAITDKRMILALGLDVDVEVKVGARPEPPAPTPLPALAPLEGPSGRASLHLPVVAEYDALEPVIDKALAKRAAKPFNLGELGRINASFGAAEIYGTGEGRIAVGVPFNAATDLKAAPKPAGTIWLTARPVNTANSRAISFAEVTITGDTSLKSQKLLFALANSPEFQATISGALKQNFEGDFQKLRAKLDKALAHREDGPIAYSVSIEAITTGVLEAHGQGLYLPVDIEARIDAEPVHLK